MGDKPEKNLLQSIRRSYGITILGTLLCMLLKDNINLNLRL